MRASQRTTSVETRGSRFMAGVVAFSWMGRTRFEQPDIEHSVGIGPCRAGRWPPLGIWVSRKADKSYVYDLVQI